MSDAPAALPGPASPAVRQRLIEALARRSAAHQGEVRRLLELRLAALRGSGQGGSEAAQGTTPAPAPSAALAAPDGAPGPLAALVQALNRRADAVDPATVRELRALAPARRTWSRLNAQQRLDRALAHAPVNAGPLNSQQLVHRALRLMRELAPGYLQHFSAHADALLGLERLQAGMDAGATATPRAPGAAPGKAARRRAT